MEKQRLIDAKPLEEVLRNLAESWRGTFSGPAYGNALKIVQEAPTVAGTPSWNPVAEPPKTKGCYFVTVKHWVDGKPVTRVAFWNGADWLTCGKKEKLTPRTTHWQPLPAPAEVTTCD